MSVEDVCNRCLQDLKQELKGNHSHIKHAYISLYHTGLTDGYHQYGLGSNGVPHNKNLSGDGLKFFNMGYNVSNEFGPRELEHAFEYLDKKLEELKKKYTKPTFWERLFKKKYIHKLLKV